MVPSGARPRSVELARRKAEAQAVARGLAEDTLGDRDEPLIIYYV